MIILKAMEETYLSITHGYTEPDEFRAGGETFKRVRSFLLYAYEDYHKRYPNAPYPDKFRFNNAELVEDNSIPEGEIRFIVIGSKKKGIPHLEAVLRLEGNNGQ